MLDQPAGHQAGLAEGVAAVALPRLALLLVQIEQLAGVAPLLSVRLGDFWSAAVFVPIVGGVYVTLVVVKRRLLAPRIGEVRLGSYRQARLQRLVLVLTVINVVALVAGFFFAYRFDPGNGLSPVIFLAATILVGFSLAAYFLNIPRFFIYGLLLAVGPFVGEWLWRRGYASHHGWPVVFGTAAAVIAAIGLYKLVALIRAHPPLSDEPLAGEDR